MYMSVIVCSGLIGGETPIGRMRVRPSEIGTASELFSSTYILRMGLHFDRYVVSGYVQSFTAIRDIYSTTMPAATLTKKVRAPSVAGNIGEAIASMVARRKLGAKQVGDIQPVLASPTAKAPDYRIRLRPMFPMSFQTAIGAAHTVDFDRWPVESKAVATSGQATKAVREALQQLATYWYERYPHEPSVVGYGIAVCLAYRMDFAGGRLIRIHVFSPSNQAALLQEMANYRAANNDRAGFLTQMRTSNSAIRGYINALD